MLKLTTKYLSENHWVK